MAIIRKKYTKEYTVVPNKIITNSRLSYKARGIFLYLFHLPDNWEISLKDIENHSESDGQASVRSGVKELEDEGYLRYEVIRKKGRFQDVDWILSDFPDLENPNLVIPNQENQNTLKYYPKKVLSEESTKEKPPSLSPQNNHVKNVELQPSPPADIASSPYQSFENLFTNQGNIHQKATQVIRHLNTITGRRYNNTRYIAERLMAGATVEQCTTLIDWIHEVMRVNRPDWVRDWFDSATPFKEEQFDKYNAAAQEWHHSGRMAPSQSSPETMLSKHGLATLHARDNLLARRRAEDAQYDRELRSVPRRVNKDGGVL